MMEDEKAVAELYKAMDVTQAEELLQKVMVYANLEGRALEDGRHWHDLQPGGHDLPGGCGLLQGARPGYGGDLLSDRRGIPGPGLHRQRLHQGPNPQEVLRRAALRAGGGQHPPGVPGQYERLPGVGRLRRA